MSDKKCTAIKITVAVVFCRSFAPTVPIINIGPADEQKEQALVAVKLLASLSPIILAPIG